MEEEKLLDTVKVVINSLRRYLKLFHLQDPVSWPLHVVLDSAVLGGPALGASLDNGTFLRGNVGSKRQRVRGAEAAYLAASHPHH